MNTQFGAISTGTPCTCSSFRGDQLVSLSLSLLGEKVLFCLKNWEEEFQGLLQFLTKNQHIKKGDKERRNSS